ncbi:MAG: glutamine synthetase [Promethearchaeota archaeon]
MTAIKDDLKVGAGPSPSEPVAKAKGILKPEKVKWILCAFTDIRGIFQSFSSPVHHFLEGTQYFETEIGFNRSSIRGFKELHGDDEIKKTDYLILKDI